jgi:hypothetical protein
MVDATQLPFQLGAPKPSALLIFLWNNPSRYDAGATWSCEAQLGGR